MASNTRKKSSKHGKSSSTLLTVGLDIGYGMVKAVADGDAVQFPSVWGRAHTASFETAATRHNYQGDDITDDQGEWLAGYKAQRHILPASLMSLRGRTRNEEMFAHRARIRLAKIALGKLIAATEPGDTIHITLATGLPVDHMEGAGGLKALLTGQHEINTDEHQMVANITTCYVMPQPYGTLYREMLRADGSINEFFRYRRTGILDVGTYTIDAALDHDGEYIASRSGSEEAGIYLVQQAIAQDYERRFNQKPSTEDIEQGVRTGSIMVHGTWEDFTEPRAEAIATLCDASTKLTTRLWSGGADIDKIFITGGGADLIIHHIKETYPQADITAGATTANAQGYRHFALSQQ